LLLDEHFNLKIADFGFAGPLAGRNGSGYLTTNLGSQPYMAPEIHESKPYKGVEIDLFAAAVIIFTMISGGCPFYEAKNTDQYYRMIMKKQWDMFWKFHSKNKPAGMNFFSLEFKNLMFHMLANDPSERLTIEEILEHPWMKGPIATRE
jgi:serine/threonine protein kinase